MKKSKEVVAKVAADDPRSADCASMDGFRRVNSKSPIDEEKNVHDGGSPRADGAGNFATASKLLALAIVGLSAGLSSCCRNCGEEEIPNRCACPSQQDVCSTLSCEEIYFANLLTEKNRKAFCSRFSAEQRKAAMLASCHSPMFCGSDRNAGKKVVKPNDAVTAIMRDNNMTMSEKRATLSKSDEI